VDVRVTCQTWRRLQLLHALCHVMGIRTKSVEEHLECSSTSIQSVHQLRGTSMRQTYQYSRVEREVTDIRLGSTESRAEVLIYLYLMVLVSYCYTLIVGMQIVIFALKTEHQELTRSALIGQCVYSVGNTFHSSIDQVMISTTLTDLYIFSLKSTTTPRFHLRCIICNTELDLQLLTAPLRVSPISSLTHNADPDHSTLKPMMLVWVSVVAAMLGLGVAVATVLMSWLIKLLLCFLPWVVAKRENNNV